jgi:hypothetical protein
MLTPRHDDGPLAERTIWDALPTPAISSDEIAHPLSLPMTVLSYNISRYHSSFFTTIREHTAHHFIRKEKPNFLLGGMYLCYRLWDIVYDAVGKKMLTRFSDA